MILEYSSLRPLNLEDDDKRGLSYHYFGAIPCLLQYLFYSIDHWQYMGFVALLQEFETKILSIYVAVDKFSVSRSSLYFLNNFQRYRILGTMGQLLHTAVRNAPVISQLSQLNPRFPRH